ncbi:hypothetical protein [Lyngbya confervoides]|uniref:Uncharacterized protein n=1 Tax=Lyngbya confervoides BDU141951 TaxID=1574623 RepID=A0ABD4T5D7_9CYAN|nr:hypothetical protein [Lyngbya confervoides]MCM1983898.1 hypothetical protein [Lyngbya confervoides BDU141951]
MAKRILPLLGLEFWLPLPLIGAGFWLGSAGLSHWVMGQPARDPERLSTQVQPPITLSLSLTITSLDAEIDRDSGRTEVTVQTSGSALQELEFEYPLVEFTEIEAAIAHELHLSLPTIRRLIRYRIDS